MRDNIYLGLISVFAPLSLMSIGGGQSVVADIHQQAVEVRQWVSQGEFVELFAISRAAPGPGALLATLVGWRTAGWLGALTASLALFMPSSLLAYGAASVWRRHDGRRIHRILENGLAPVATGLMLASAVTVMQSSSQEVRVWAIALAAAAIFLIWKRASPLAVLFGAGLAGALL